MDPDMVLCHNPGSDVTMTLGGSAGHPDYHGHSSSVLLEHQDGLKRLTKHWLST